MNFGRLLRDYSEWSTLVCLNKIVTSTGKMPAIFGIIFVAMCALFLFTSGICIHKFYKFPATFEYSDEMESMAFPLFAFCNENPLKRSVVESDPVYAQISQLLEQYELIEQNGTTRDDFGLSSTESPLQPQHRAQFMLRLLMTKLNDTDRINAGYSFSELVTECTFSGVTCTSADFTSFLHPDYGVCYSFNGNRTITRPVKSQGLQLMFAVNQDAPRNESFDFLPTTDSASIWGVLYNDGDLPDFTNDGFKVGVSSQMFIGLSKITYTRLNSPYGKCTTDSTENYQGFNYTYQTCQHACMQQLALLSCGCVDPLYNKAENETFCSSAADMICLMNFTAKLAAANSGGGKKMCWCESPCHQTVYQLSMTSSSFPSENYAVAAGTEEQRAALMDEQGRGAGCNEDSTFYDNSAQGENLTCPYKGPPESAHDAISSANQCKSKYPQVYSDPNIIAIVGFPCNSTKVCNTCIILLNPPSIDKFICDYPRYPDACLKKANSGYLAGLSCSEFFKSFDFIPLGTSVPNITNWRNGALPSDITTCNYDSQTAQDDCFLNSVCKNVPTSKNLSKLDRNETPLDSNFLANLANSTIHPCHMAYLAFDAAKLHYSRNSGDGATKNVPSVVSGSKIDIPGVGSCEYANQNFLTAAACIDWYKRNSLKINIWFDTLQEKRYTQVPTYPVNLISDVAGHAGLWLGVSVVTIVEIVGLLVMAIAVCFGAHKCCYAMHQRRQRRIETVSDEFDMELEDIESARSI